jgi:ATP-dependent RNA circularization protein (DNA/RNA ligase family)
MLLEFNKPIPVIVEENKEGYALYVSDSGMFENDVWCVVLCEGGIIRHYTTDQIKVFYNATFSITKKQNNG